MSQFLSEALSKLCAYVPGEQPQNKQYIKLNTNESPFAPSPSAMAHISAEALENLRRYNDPCSTGLTQAIAQFYDVQDENVITTNGSDEILAFIFLAYGSGKTTAFADITYGFYSVFAQLYALQTRIVPLRENFELCVDDYNMPGENVILANPNAPTGKTVSLQDIERLCKFHPHDVVVVDEAYVDFGAESAVPLTKSYQNLIVVQTFSKSRNLAGARIGFAIAHSALIADLQRIRNSFNPYNVNALSQILGTCAMQDKAYFLSCIEQIIKTRENFTAVLKTLHFDVLDSKANFVFAKHAAFSGAQLYEKLKQHGILVRFFDKPRISSYVRITIGTHEDMNVVVQALQDITKQKE